MRESSANMKAPHLAMVLFSFACFSTAAHAIDLQRSAYQESSKINKYSRKYLLSIVPKLTEVRSNRPVPYRYAGAPVTMPEHSWSTESIYNQPGYRPASNYSAYVATDVGGFGGRAYRYNTGSYYYPYVDSYYSGYYPASTVFVGSRGVSYCGGYGRGSVIFRAGAMYGRVR